MWLPRINEHLPGIITPIRCCSPLERVKKGGIISHQSTPRRASSRQVCQLRLRASRQTIRLLRGHKGGHTRLYPCLDHQHGSRSPSILLVERNGRDRKDYRGSYHCGATTTPWSPGSELLLLPTRRSGAPEPSSRLSYDCLPTR